MNTSSDNDIQKPKIIEALKAGFDTIASNPYLILFPIMLDMFLWFGPSWRVEKFFKRSFEQFITLPGMEPADIDMLIESYQTFWQDLTVNIDLARSLRTLPVGVPSLMVSKPSFLNPLGQPPVINLESSLQVMAFLGFFLVIGYLLGSIYFSNISGQIVQAPENTGNLSFFRTFLQIILFPLILLVIFIVLSFPGLFILGFATMISPAISQFLIFAVGVILLWVLMPLVFTPHCIFLYRQNLIAAMMTSINVVKTSMGKTAWFIIISFILIEGMDMLWRTPDVDNWFLLIGILGHAFVVTAVIAASFHYFLDATRFTQSIMNRHLKTA
ncbi:MAG: hypothetical protein ACOCYU_05225 [Brevefilum sp.]